MEDINVTIWKNLLKQGADPQHVYKLACNHEKALEALPQSDERDTAIFATAAFIRTTMQDHQDSLDPWR